MVVTGHMCDPFCYPTEELTSPGGGHHFPHPTNELKAPKGKGIHSRSHSPSVVELGIKHSVSSRHSQRHPRRVQEPHEQERQGEKRKSSRTGGARPGDRRFRWTSTAGKAWRGQGRWDSL